MSPSIKVTSLVFILISSGLAGCFGGDDASDEDEKPDSKEEGEEEIPMNNPPDLVLWNISKVWDGSQPTFIGAVFDDDLGNITVTYELLDSTNFSTVSGPFIATIADDGSFTFDLPVVNPGAWIITVSATDGEKTTEASAGIEIIAPTEPAAILSFIWLQPEEGENIGKIIGNVNHVALETCIVGYDPMGNAIIILAELNHSSGSMEIAIDTDDVLLEGDISASCGRFTSTNTVIHVILDVDVESDADQDGILDEDDLCDSTPEGEPVYSDGCSDSQRDGDNDGIADSDDICPQTPVGEIPDSDGCSASQRDGDADGVSDAVDQCPNSETGVVVDTVGCQIIIWEPEDSWVCQNGGVGPIYDLNEQYGYQGNSKDPFTCSTVVSIDDANGEINIAANGIPNHDFTSTRGCCTDEVDYDWSFPLQQVNDSDGSYESGPARGAVGVAVNGAPLFGPEDGPGGDAIALHYKYYHEDRQQIDLGICGGHSAGSTYHYHWDANCILWEAGEGEDMTDYSWTKIDSTVHSGIIAWAFDGYPIYGLYGWDELGGVVQVKSSYQLKANGNDGYDGTDDWEYVEGLGDLDECNGRFGPTPEYPDGIYHYVSTPLSGSSNTHTDTDGNSVEMIGFPYFLMCYHGQATGGPKGGGGQGGPPPGIVYPSATLHGDGFAEQPTNAQIVEQIWNLQGVILLLIILASGVIRRRGKSSA